MAEREQRSYGKVRTAASIAAELVAPTAVSEVLRAKRGSSLGLSLKESRDLTTLEGLGGVTVFMASPTLGSTFYVAGKLLEFQYLRKKK